MFGRLTADGWPLWDSFLTGCLIYFKSGVAKEIYFFFGNIKEMLKKKTTLQCKGFIQVYTKS